MFYYLYLRFHTENHLFNLFRYITFRTAYASMTALVLSLVLGPWVIERLKKFQIGQYIREDGPQSHQSKAGTPTMGGILINLCIVVPTLMWADLRNFFVWLVLGITLVVTARVVYGFWRTWHAWRAAYEHTAVIAAAGVAGSLAAGGVVLGYYVIYWAGVRRRIRRHARDRGTL